MSTGVSSPGRAQVPEKTLRQDNWWVSPLLVFLGFTAFVVYSSWRAFSGDNYYSTPYLSPFYSPCLAVSCVEGSSDLGQPIGGWWKLSPALIILAFPLGFRLTCYYYRKAYYRAFWLSPPACGVGEPHGKYSGENRFPLIFQNVHRYFWVAAVLISLVLTLDTVLAFRNEEGEWGHMGLGTLIFIANIVFIWLYTLGCHSCRHILGGRLRHFSKHPVRYKAWGLVSKLNARHALYAWLSLISVAVADLYVFLLATDTITDLRFF